MNSKSTTKSWAVRPKPQDDELLSSWVTRIANANGISPFQLWKILVSELEIEGISNSDLKVEYWGIDDIVDENIFNLLSERTSTVVERVKGLSLESFSVIELQPLTSRRHNMWILPRKGTSNSTLAGIQFCPECLSEDLIPYFRRKWRLSFVFSCLKHKRLLFDRCPKCHRSLKFFVSELKEKHQVNKTFLTCCYCKYDLRKAKLYRKKKLDEQEILIQSTLLNAFYSEEIYINNKKVHAFLYFVVIDTLINILIKDYYRDIILPEICRYFNLDYTPIDFKDNYKSFEVLGVYERRLITMIVGQMLDDWPNNFVKFCQCNFPVWHIELNEDIRGNLTYSGSLLNMHYLPDWFFNSIKEPLLGVINKEMFVSKKLSELKDKKVVRYIKSELVSRYSEKYKRFRFHRTRPRVIVETWCSELMKYF